MRKLQEPITALTDVLLFVANGALFLTLFLKSGAAVGVAAKTYLFWWSLFFLGALLSAFIGFFHHGYALGTRWEVILGKCHASLLGISMVLFVLTSILIFGGLAVVWQFIWIPLAVFGLYEVTILRRYDYRYFIVYGIAMLVGGLTLTSIAFGRGLPALWVIVGIGMIALAGLLQAMRVSWRFLGHNDVYHLVLLCSLPVLLVGIMTVSRALAG